MRLVLVAVLLAGCGEVAATDAADFGHAIDMGSVADLISVDLARHAADLCHEVDLSTAPDLSLPGTQWVGQPCSDSLACIAPYQCITGPAGSICESCGHTGGPCCPVGGCTGAGNPRCVDDSQLPGGRCSIE